jgi:hypothetical protein
MKVIVILVILVGLVAVGFYFAGSSMSELDPNEQGRQTRAAVRIGAPWTEVLEEAGEPQAWADEATTEFALPKEFNEAAREQIAKRLEEDDLRLGFAFLYRFSGAITFVVNFDKRGNAINIRDQMSQKELLDGGL